MVEEREWVWEGEKQEEVVEKAREEEEEATLLVPMSKELLEPRQELTMLV